MVRSRAPTWSRSRLRRSVHGALCPFSFGLLCLLETAHWLRSAAACCVTGDAADMEQWQPEASIQQRGAGVEPRVLLGVHEPQARGCVCAFRPLSNCAQMAADGTSSDTLHLICQLQLFTQPCRCMCSAKADKPTLYCSYRAEGRPEGRHRVHLRQRGELQQGVLHGRRHAGAAPAALPC